MSTLTKVILLLNLSLATTQVKTGEQLGGPAVGLFEHTTYEDICDKNIITESQSFGIQAIYENLYIHQRSQNLFNEKKFEDEYQAHLDNIQKYIQDLELFKKFSEEGNLKENGQIHFKVRLRKFIQLIQQKIASSKQLNLQPMNQEFKDFLEYYERRLQMMGSSNSSEFLSYLSLESYQYATSELEVDQNPDFYFHEEVCALESIIIDAIEYYTKQSTDNSQVGDNMDQFDKQLVTNFITEAMQFDFENSGRTACQLNPLWLEIIRNFTNRDDEKENDKELNRNDLQKLGGVQQDFYTRLYDHSIDGQKSMQQSITKRDFILTYFPFLKQQFDLKFLDKIEPNAYKYRYSPHFMTFLLKELPEFINDKNLYPKNVKDPTEQQDYLIKIIILFYDLYVQGRHFEQDEVIDFVPYLQEHQKETIIWLRNFLKIMGEDDDLFETFTTEDPEQRNVIIDTEEPLKNKLQIILIIEEYLDINDPDYDANKRVEEFLKSVKQKLPTPEDFEFQEEIIYNQINETEEISYVPKKLKNKLDVKQKTRSINNVLKTIHDFDIEAEEIDNTPLDESPMEFISPLLNKRQSDENQRRQASPGGDPLKQKEIVDKMQSYLVKILTLVKDVKNLEPEKKDFFIEQFLNNLENTMDKMNTNTKLAKFVKAMEPIFSRKTSDIQKYLNLEDKKEVNELKDIIKEFRKKMIIKLKTRITSNLHLGSGLLKVLSWKAKYTTDRKSLDLVGDVMKRMNVELGEADKNLVQLDICLLYQNVQKLVDDQIYSHLKEYAERVIQNSNYQKLCVDVVDSYETQHDFVADFSRIQMGITFMKYFEIFDSFEISQSEVNQSNPTHKKLLNEESRKYLVEFYNKFYVQSLYFRLSTGDDYNHPTRFFVQQVQNCVQETFDRTQYVEDTDCPYEHSHYHDILSFLNYYFGSKAIVPKPQQIMNMELPTEVNMNTTLLNMLLEYTNNTYLSTDQICNADQNHQLCEESKIYQELIDNSDQKNLLTNLLQNEEEQIGDKKYILWNAFVNLITLHSLSFKQIFADYQNHKKSELVDEVCKLLNVNKSANWVSNWMKVNFGNNTADFNQLRTKIQNIYSEDKLQDYLLFKETITYNSTPQDVQLVRINQIQPFVYLSGSVQNYSQLYSVIQEHAWIIIYLKASPGQSLADLVNFSNKIANLPMDGDFSKKFDHYWQTSLVQKEKQQLQVVEKNKKLDSRGSSDLFDSDTESEHEESEEEEGDLTIQNNSQTIANNKSKQLSIDFEDEVFENVASDTMKANQNNYITQIQEFEFDSENLTPDMLLQMVNQKVVENAMQFNQEFKQVVDVDVQVIKKLI